MSFGRDKIISVANMYFNSVVYVTEDSYLATYNVMRLGDIAFEGNRSKRFAHGRFVENTIGDGIVSHVFKVFRPVGNNFDLSYWKHAINNEKLMKDVLTRSTKASTMMHELVSSDFLEESTLVPSLDEQRAIGTAIDSMDSLITLHQREPPHMMKEDKKCQSASMKNRFSAITIRNGLASTKKGPSVRSPWESTGSRSLGSPS